MGDKISVAHCVNSFQNFQNSHQLINKIFSQRYIPYKLKACIQELFEIQTFLFLHIILLSFVALSGICLWPRAFLKPFQSLKQPQN